MKYGVETVYGLEYGDEERIPLVLDLYLPNPRPEKCPTVVYFHGGGWARGSRTDYVNERILPLVRSGIAVAAASYRFIASAIWPAQLEDATRALEVVLAAAPTFGLDACRISTWGASAGGHLASMLALRSPTREKIAGTIVWFAPTDLAMLSKDPLPEKPVLPEFMQGGWTPPTFHIALVGARNEGLDERLRAASPSYYAETPASPFLLFHGDRDPVVPPAQTTRFQQRLIDAGTDADYHLVVGATHEDKLFHRPSVLGSMVEFIKSLPPVPAVSTVSEGGAQWLINPSRGGFSPS